MTRLDPASNGNGHEESGLASQRKPNLLVIGGDDVHRRIDLLLWLSKRFGVAAAGSEPCLGDRFRHAGLDYYHYSLSRGVSPVGDLASVFRLYRLIRRLSPDIVHTFGTKPSLWGRFAACLAGTPVVVGTLPGLGSLYVHGGPVRRLLRAVYGRLQWVCCRVSDATILQNVDDARELEATGIVPSSKVAILPGSGVRTDVFDPSLVPVSARMRVRNQVGASRDSIIVTMVSRLIRSKGVGEFVRAAELLKSRCGSVVFVLVGPDDQQSVERLTADELGHVRESVCWLGERRDIRDILGASDVAVLPSYYREGIPRVLLEAASMGLPLISTRSPGCKEVVRDGINGILVEPRSPVALAAAMERLIRDSDLRRRFGAASRSHCIQRFDLSVVADQTEALYRRLLGHQDPQTGGDAGVLQRSTDRSSHAISVAL